jgi:hypothetical protein
MTSVRRAMTNPDLSRALGPAALVGLAAALGALLVLSDLTLAGRGLFDEGPPRLGWAWWVRSGMLATVAGALVLAGRGRAAQRWPPRDRGSVRDSRPSGQDWIAAGTGAAVALAGGLLVAVRPAALSSLAQEDGPIEWSSAAVLLVAAAMAGWAGVRWNRRRPDPRLAWPAQRGRAWACAAIAVLFMVLALEEVSFFQRQLDVPSPELFVDRNAQQELNFHNFATTATGQGYYVIGCLFGVMLPALLADRRLSGPLAWLERLVPGSAVLYGSVSAGAVVYEMWDVLLVQLTFWIGLMVLCLRFQERRNPLDAGLAILQVVVLALFLTRGGGMIRTWDDTELRELLVPLGLAFYGLGLLQAARPAVAGLPSRTGERMTADV